MAFDMIISYSHFLSLVISIKLLILIFLIIPLYFFKKFDFEINLLKNKIFNIKIKC
jgi:hypothetical protein